MTQILTNDDGTTKSVWSINANASQALLVCSSLTTDRSFTLPDADGTLFLIDQLAAVSVDVTLNSGKVLRLPANGFRISDSSESGAYLNINCADVTLSGGGKVLSLFTGDSNRSLIFAGDATISGTNTGDQTSVSGNAGTATTLQTTRTIGGSNFNGSADVTSFPVPGAIGGTTPAPITCTNLTINGNTIVGDASSDTLTINPNTWTLPNSVIWNKTAQAGVGETLISFKISDDSVGNLLIGNASATDGVFAPYVQGTHPSTGPGFNFTGRGTTDTGSVGAILFVGQTASGGALATRPVAEFRNLTTSVFVIGSSGSGSFGYPAGVGGVVTQITSRTTGVTLNKPSGAIILVSAAGTAAWQSFTVTNSMVGATDTIVVNQKSGTDKNMIHVTAVAAGSFQITFATTGGTTTEQPVFNFNVIKGAAS